MKKLDFNLILGATVIIASGLTLFLQSVPIIWIGGFIWGISLIARSRSLKKTSQNQQPFKTAEMVEKEIITCVYCQQKLRIPKDRRKLTNVTCPNCHQNPLNLLTKIIDSLHKYRVIVLVMFLISLGVASYLFLPEDEIVQTPKAELPTTSVKIDSETNFPTIPAIVAVPNGEVFIKNISYFNGDGDLEIKNGTSNDAVAKLVLYDKSVFTVYIRANNNYKITNIKDGVYRLYFALGNDWDVEYKKFTKNQGFSVFENPFEFITTDTEATGYRISLNPVIGGTAKTDNVYAGEFNNY